MSMDVDEESCEVSSSIPSKRAKKRTSEVWKTFSKLPCTSNNEKLKAQCRVCKAIFAADAGTSNMKRHVAKHSEQRQEDDNYALTDQKFYREKVSVAILKHNYPFSFVEHQENRDIHSYLNPRVKTISRNTAKADILKLYDREKEFLKSEHAMIPSRVCLTSDMWTSVASNGYMCLTAHYVDLNWRLQKRVLIFRHVPPPHSGLVFDPLMIEFLKKWGIQKKVFSLTLDNASCNKGVVDILKEHLSITNSLICEGKFFHIRCANHILNLIVKSGLEEVDKSIIKVREGVKHIKHSEGRIMKFVECINDLGLPCSKKLRQDITTRWNSTYQMLESALLYRKAYIQYKLLDSDFKFSLSDEEWEMVERVARLLKPFYEITTLFSGSKYPTANLYLLNVWKIQKLLEEENYSSEGLNVMATLILKKFKKYWRPYSMILSIATVLDPRYKMKFVRYIFSKIDSETTDAKVKKVEDHLQLLFKSTWYLRPQVPC